MSQAFGIASLVLSIVAIFIPVFGVFIAGLSGILAWISTGRALFLGVAAVIINLCNIFLLSPTFLILIALESSQRTAEQHKLFTIWSVVLFIQIAAIAIFIFNTILLHFLKAKRSTGQADGEADQRKQRSKKRTASSSEKKESDKEINRSFWNAVIGRWYVRAFNRLQARDITAYGVVVFLFFIASLAVYHIFLKDEPWVPYNRTYEQNKSITETEEHKASDSSKNGVGTYHPDNQQAPGSNINTPDRIYSYRKADGSTSYTNTAPPSDGKAIQERPELVAERFEMPIEIQDGQIFVPVSIEHRGNKFDTSFLLDPEASNTILPQRNADFVRANHLTNDRYRITEGTGPFYEMREVELILVGPKSIKNFRVVTRIGESQIQRGVLGHDFLKNFTYQIDQQRRVITWY